MRKKKPHPQHVAIAKALGTTPGSLKSLLSIKAGRGSLNRGAWLMGKGLVDVVYGKWALTNAGAELLDRARKMGF